MNIFKFSRTQRKDRDDGSLYRIATPCPDLVSWIDANREEGWVAAIPLFPRHWEWVDVDQNQAAIADFSPATGVGEVLSPRAFELFRGVAGQDFAHFFPIDVEGRPFIWIERPYLFPEQFGKGAVPVEVEVAQAIRKYASDRRLPAVFSFFARGHAGMNRLCTEGFQLMVEGNGLTGLEFELFCEI